MIKKKLALSGALLLAPIAALAQEANPTDTTKPLPPVTVLSDKKAEPAKHKVAKKKNAAKSTKAAVVPSQQPADVDLSLSGAEGPQPDSQGVMPPSVTAQTVGGVIVSDPTLGRVSSVSREGLNILGGAAQTNFYQGADIIPSVNVESPDPFGLSNTRNINVLGKGDFHLSRNINGLPIMGIVGGNDLYDLENISRLDVYRGPIPADKSLGVSNASGVIDQIILGPQDGPSTFAEQSFGSWDFNKTFARLDTGLLSTGTQLFISGSTASADKWTGAGDESRDSFALGLSQKIGDDLKVDINTVYSKFDGNPYKALTYKQTQNLDQYYGLDYDKILNYNKILNDAGVATSLANYYQFNRVTSEDFAVLANIDYRFAEGQHLVFKPYYWNNDGEQWSGSGTSQVQIWRQQNDNLGGVLEYNGHFATGTDVSLGYWWPVQEKAIAPFVDAKSINVLQPPNLTGAKATFAVPSYEYDAGLKTFADIAKHRAELDGKIYGIEPGSSANAAIQKMIATNQFGLGGFKLIESSEAGMLVTVERAVREKKWVVFLGWQPHPMNIQIDMKYLSGSEGVFGPNDGEARVYTLTSPDFLTRCPNAGKLVSNLRFTTQLENVVMQSVMNKEKPAEAAKAYLKKNPQVLDEWLAGVKTYDGKDGLPAVKAYLGL